MFRLTEATRRNLYSSAYEPGERLVAKECRYEEDIQKQHTLGAGFHLTFCKTQGQASRLAEKFNEQLAKSCRNMFLSPVGGIEFLKCRVYEIPETGRRNTFRYILVEKRLDTTKYEKWNSNNGHVKGHQTLASVFARKKVDYVAPSAAAPKATHLYRITEESDEEDSDNDAVDISRALPTPRSQRYDIKTEHVPQAFSHWTYRYTKRKMLVCDLQGVLDMTKYPPLYEMTDPVIHYSSDSQRKAVYGRTDHGTKGMHTFFQTHTCNDVCCLLGLSAFHYE